MKSLLLLLLLVAAAPAFAQTERIAWKSHSGGPVYESTDEAPDFGAAPERNERYAKLDSLIFLSDSLAVMVTSNWCKPAFSDERAATRWRAGRDTVRQHPLFSRRHSLDSIKLVLRQYYYFRNPTDSVRFIGYDNSNSCEDYQPFSVLPVSGGGGNDDVPPASTRVLLLALVSIASAFTGLAAWLLRRTPAVA